MVVVVVMGGGGGVDAGEWGGGCKWGVSGDGGRVSGKGGRMGKEVMVVVGLKEE